MAKCHSSQHIDSPNGDIVSKAGIEFQVEHLKESPCKRELARYESTARRQAATGEEARVSKNSRKTLFQSPSGASLSQEAAPAGVVSSEPDDRRVCDSLSMCSQRPEAKQVVQYTACSQPEEDEKFVFYLQDCFGGVTPLSKKEGILIGRRSKNDVVINDLRVSRNHCKLTIHKNEYCLQPHKPCWKFEGNKWHQVETGTEARIPLGCAFRLLPPSNEPKHNQARHVQFIIIKTAALPPCVDHQYLWLLRTIEREGMKQENKKGANITLPRPVTMEIDLTSEDGTKDLLPLTTLRKMPYQQSIIEGVCYLRGEDHAAFLKRNRCPFWDAQAYGDGFLGGLNYGLLTNFPGQSCTRINQLEEVIKKLAARRRSRNMVCSLTRPEEKTVQGACTACVQFSIKESAKGIHLDVNVVQRSSDVILGLPHDLFSWALICHLVRREVARRSDVNLLPGKLYFSISPGGARVYKINEESFKELLQRQPVLGVEPHLAVDGDKEGIFEMAMNYNTEAGKTQVRVVGYTKDDCREKLNIEQATEK